MTPDVSASSCSDVPVGPDSAEKYRPPNAVTCAVAYCRGGHEPGGLHDIPPCLKTCEWVEVGVARRHDPACPNAQWSRR